jgi:uncharacterized membrane protein YhaH (DUF805 family)
MTNRSTFLWPILIVGLTVVPVVLLHKHQAAHKWDILVFWTVVTFVPVIKLSQRRWGAIGFWGEIALIFAVHLTLLALMFSHMGANTHLPLVLALPAAWVEITGILKILNVRENHHRPK